MQLSQYICTFNLMQPVGVFRLTFVILPDLLSSRLFPDGYFQAVANFFCRFRSVFGQSIKRMIVLKLIKNEL